MGPRLRPTFGTMRDYLTGLGFTSQVPANKQICYRDPQSDHSILQRTLADHETVSAEDLATARLFLTQWGYVSDDEFDQFLVESILTRYARQAEPANSGPT